MSIDVVVDTHAIIWYFANDRQLSANARTYLQQAVNRGDSIAISSITFAEMVYLVEKQRIDSQAFDRLVWVINQVNTNVVEIPVDHRIIGAMTQIARTDVPDLPDRIIAATALYLNVPLIRRDRKIQSSIVTTIW
ncbi:MAG: type II toxin-antitoxin system VapC family toxin [Herpetosiphon sp.]|nr:type II toxin-antitoxin system VapC family toxin [Herpetosiphon sp.]